ncbi:glycosyltransferase [Propionicimonas sp.]|uniref:glycosyltransferase n=1 Tax=Propionicimonas sp. TaxID=1955623 RepID=UPI0017997BF0|nr:glycosyltransferase [Propionicimonas sp.]MBU3978045.1 glycosyltransferase [Actinomycetota bacterium]MBA3021969.1 glycosyltransferase [Propionicimonas sp.]MBU3985513.1 glycosyltransferase [Actinomycetota bacterium]MBU4007676.1 glycosyltransferase [Actinomycetota bacterium]MBU4064451.1 glycosyltransferase [Actinomycetota bacterium]
MRIISVVSLITPDGAYGGPVRVAVNQAKALIALGHDVRIAAATRGFDQPPTELDQVPLHLFDARTVLPGTGFAGITSPGLLRWLPTALPSADVVHLHAARDLITLPAAALARRAKVPYFLQTHGMIDPSTNPLAKPLDAFLTKGLLHDAAGVFHLTDLERAQLLEVAGELNFLPLANGVPVADYTAAPQPPEVLYLARLAPRKRPLVFIEAARRLQPDFPTARFSLVGPDEGEGPAVRAAIDAARAEGVAIEWSGGLSPELTLDRLRDCSIYVLPSVNEPYPMSVLEALSVGRPVVITDTCGLADLVKRHQAGAVVDHGVDSLVTAISQLLSDPSAAVTSGERGRAAVGKELSMAAIAAQLAAHYSAALSS